MVSEPNVQPANLVLCPRCDTRLQMGYDEPECPCCGFVDYSYDGAPINNQTKSLVSSGTRSVVRYKGDSPHLFDVTTIVEAVRVGNKLTHQVACPFSMDGKIMIQSSLSGKRREVREERFKCEEGHRLSLVPTRHGLAWK